MHRQAQMKPIVASYANGIIIGFDMNKSLRKSIPEMSIIFAFVLYIIIIQIICPFSQLPWSPTSAGCFCHLPLLGSPMRNTPSLDSFLWTICLSNQFESNLLEISCLCLSKINPKLFKTLIKQHEISINAKYILCFFFFFFFYSVFLMLLLLFVKKLN